MFIMTYYYDLFFDHFPYTFSSLYLLSVLAFYINIPLRTMIVIPGSKSIYTKSVKAVTRIQQNV